MEVEGVAYVANSAARAKVSFNMLALRCTSVLLRWEVGVLSSEMN